MSDDRYLLLFPGEEGTPLDGWLRIDAQGVAARGRDLPPPAEADVAERIVAVVPGPDVAVHWAELRNLSNAQAAAAARLIAADAVMQPADRLHVAVGPADETGQRPMAIVEKRRMTEWLTGLQALSLDPDHVVPETLLIPPPPDGAVRWARGGLHLVRGQRVAFAAEPAIAEMVAPAPLADIGEDAVERGLPAVLGALPIDLRQGAFARHKPWTIDWKLLRRLVLMTAGVFLLAFLIQLVLILRYTVAADRLEGEIAVIARKALPRAERIANAPAQLAERLAALRGGGRGFSATAAGVFAAVRDVPGIELTDLRYDTDGALRLTATANAASDIAALQQRIEAQGFTVGSGPVQAGGARQSAELTVRAR